MSPRQVIQWVKSSGILARAGGLALVFLAGGLLYVWLRPTPAHAATSLAYTVMRTEAVYDNTGTQRYTNYYVEAQRADGSKVFRSTTNDVQNRELYFANGDHIRVNELMGAKTTYPGVSGEARVMRSPDESCVSRTELQAGWLVNSGEPIGGYRTARATLTTRDGPLTIWYGLDLGCAVLQLRLQHSNGATEQKLTAVIPGEPDPALFQLSAALNEVPPSELLSCSRANCGPLPAGYNERVDQHYYEIRARAAAGTKYTSGVTGN